MPSLIPIVSSLLVGLAATFGTIIVHGFVVYTIVMTLRRNLKRHVLGARLWVNMTFISSAMLFALLGISRRSRYGPSRSIYPVRLPISARPSIHRRAATRLRVPRSYCRCDGSWWDP
jgi:hypothetical protein